MLLIMHTWLSNLPQIPNPTFIADVEQIRKFKSNIFHKRMKSRKTIPSKQFSNPCLLRQDHRQEMLMKVQVFWVVLPGVIYSYWLFERWYFTLKVNWFRSGLLVPEDGGTTLNRNVTGSLVRQLWRHVSLKVTTASCFSYPYNRPLFLEPHKLDAKMTTQTPSRYIQTQMQTTDAFVSKYHVLLIIIFLAVSVVSQITNVEHKAPSSNRGR